MQRSLCLGLFAGIAALGCSDPAPPVSEVGAHYTVTGNCTLRSYGGIGATEPLVEGGEVGVPELPPGGGAFPSDKGGPIIDGQEGPNPDLEPFDVHCTVKGDGDLSISASLKGQNISEWATGNEKIKTSISLQATLSKDGTGTGSVTFFTPTTQTVTGEDCTFTAVPDNAGKPQMGPGQLFAIFSCPGVRMNSATEESCTSEGTLVFDNCSTN